MSSSDLALSIQGVSKCYKIAPRQEQAHARLPGLGQRLRDALKQPARKEEFWALKDISFDVQQGDVIGIIGRNGAGKSTLLKILSRITEPTAGQVDVFGRVGSLLEVGTGFHPELTGRENVFLNGAILGMSRAEISRRFDEIVEFSGVEKFLETPVKRYSSGMYVRLAFAVAAHLEPEILIVDEVLAVGDAEFQKKCLGKMQDVAALGRTVLFVSHNMTAVQSLCSACVWLGNGRVLESGPTAKICANYLNVSFADAAAERIWDDPAMAPGNGSVRLRRAAARPEGGTTADPIIVSTTFVVEFEYWNLEPRSILNLSLVFYTEDDVIAFNTTSLGEPAWDGRPYPSGLFMSTCTVPGNLLNDGAYQVRLLVVKDRGHVLFELEDALVFDVCEDTETRSGWMGKWVGAVRPRLDWSTELLKSGPDSAGIVGSSPAGALR